MPKTISIIGGGIGGLATAVLLAKSGHKVSVYEKNECRGGRAGMFEANGYRFDMGPSWYLMPDLFEEYFEMIGENIHDHLDLKQLSPSYKVFWDGSIDAPTLSDIWKQKIKKYESTVDGYIYSARAHIKDEYGRTLVLYDHRRDAYNVPGGKVDAGEDSITTLTREVEEEIGVKVIKATYLGKMKGIRSGGLVCHIHYEVIVEGVPTIKEPEKFSKISWATTNNRQVFIDDQNIQHLYNDSNKRRRHCYDNCEVMDLDVLATITDVTPVHIPLVRDIIPNDIYVSLYDYSSQSIHVIHENHIEHFDSPYIYLGQYGHELQSGINMAYGDVFQSLNVYSNIDRMATEFESLEPGAGEKFKTFLQKSGEQYTIGMDFAKKNYDSIFDFFRRDIAWKGMKLNIRTTIDKYVARFFKTPIVQKIMQYTTVFLGTAPSDTPAFYNIMSHVDFAMGVWYSQGGLHEIAEVLVNIGKKHGVEYFLDHELVEVEVKNKQIVAAKFSPLTRGGGEAGGILKTVSSNHYIINADQARFETTMLSSRDQTYPQNFWKKKTFAPSGFIIYAGVNKKLPNLEHHNLYFNEDRNKSFGDIFDRKLMPEDPSLYICAPSKTDPNVAPEGKENLFVLVPIPNGIEISPEQKSSYREKVWKIVEQMAGEEILPYVQYEQIFEVDDFKQRYNARNGTALGLAHTMMQTACFRPNNYSKKLDNLFYVGHNTNPGIGIPMVIMSAILVTQRMQQKGVL